MRVVGTVPFKNTCTVEESRFKAETKKMFPCRCGRKWRQERPGHPVLPVNRGVPCEKVIRQTRSIVVPAATGNDCRQICYSSSK